MNYILQKIHSFVSLTAIGFLLILAGCQTLPPPVQSPTLRLPTPIIPAPQTSSESNEPTAPVPTAPVTVLPSTTPLAETLIPVNWSDLPGWSQDNHAAVLPGLLASCPFLKKQTPWRLPCEAARQPSSPEEAKSYFENYFTAYRVMNPQGSGEGLITGYYEPLLKGSRKSSATYRYPIYTTPKDLRTIEPTTQNQTGNPNFTKGRWQDSQFIPYYDRAQIDSGKFPLNNQVIAWVDDPIELFFLHVQGSGRVALDNGEIIRVGFANHNGLTYRSIGKILVDRGDLSLDQASMQGIKAWAQANPKKLTPLLNQNPRYVFFREVKNADTSPAGALGIALTPQRSLAIDTRFIPLGAPVYIDTTWPLSNKSLQQLMLAQDTGGAILGAVRADFFWGSGPLAELESGRMKQALKMWLLLPKSP